jgi:hypothetical protein
LVSRRSALLAAVVAGRLPVGTVELELLEALAALGVGEVDERAAVEVQEVEDQIGDGAVGHPAPHGGVGGEVHAALEPLEAGPTVLIERDHLTVEHRLAGPSAAASGRSSG